MKLYRIQFDSISYFVEAADLGQAVAAWREHVKVEWGTDYEGTEEPQSIELIHDEPVIRPAALNVLAPS